MSFPSKLHHLALAVAAGWLLACGGGSAGSKAAATPEPPLPPMKPGPRVLYSQTTSTDTTSTTVLHAVTEDGTSDITLETFTGLGGSWAGRAGDRFVYGELVGQTDTTESWRYYSVRMDGLGRKRISGDGTDWNGNVQIVGERVVLEKGSTGELFTVPADGSKGPELLSLPGKYASAARAEGNGLIYLQTTDTPGTDLMRFRPADLSGPAVTLYTRTATAQEMLREVVAGRAIYTTSQTLCSVRLDGTDAKVLATVPNSLFLGGFTSQLALFNNNTAAGQELWAVPVDGSAPAYAIDATPNTRSWIYAPNAAFDDGQRLVYTHCNSATPNLADLYSMPLGGGTPVKLTSLADNELFKGILNGYAYFQITVGGMGMNMDLYRVPLDGSAPATPICQTTQLEMFLALLDGRLVFYRRYDDHEELLSAAPDGQDERLLATAPASLAGRPWATVVNGRIYANTQSAPATYQLFSLKADGSDKRILREGGTPVDFEDVL